VSDLVRLRVRAGIWPRPAEEPRESAKSFRRAVVLHCHVDDCERTERAIAVELLDGMPVQVLLGLPDEAARADAAVWAIEREATSVAPGVVAAVGTGDLGMLGRFVAKRCWNRRAGLVAFDFGWVVGRFASNVRNAKGGGASLGLTGCGWHHRETGCWQDSHYYPRIRLTSRGGEDSGAFAGWIPPRERRKTRQRLGGPFVGLRVLGGALGWDVGSPAALAASGGIDWPERENPLDQLLQEALVLAECYRALVAELADVAPGLPPQACWSAGSIMAHALRQAGSRSPAETTATLCPEAIGAAAASFHGCETSASLVGIATTLCLADLNWTFPAMLSLLGLTAHLAADHFEMVPVDVGQVADLFRSAGLRERLDVRAFWASIGNLFVVVEPHGEASLPCQRETGDRWRFVVTPLDLSGGTLPVHACHLIRPALAGCLPPLVSAFRVEPRGTAEGLKPLRLPSGDLVDLVTGDLGRALIDERRHADAIDDPLVRDRWTARAKGEAVSGAWGIFGRVDRQRPKRIASVRTGSDGKERRVWRYPKTEMVWAYGPAGEELSITTPRPDVPGPCTLWHFASAIPGTCDAFVATTCHDVEVTYGGTVAAIAVDSIVVPVSRAGGLEACPGGPHRLPDGREAVRRLTPDEFRSVLARADTVLHPDGGSAWKIECETLDKPSIGLVIALNKLLLGRQDEDGHFELVRSSDTGMGDHFIDPTGTGAHLDDGRTAWVAELQERFLSEVVARENDAPLRVPSDLPEWADRPALRPRQASTLDDLRRLRRQSGDPDVGLFARYVTGSNGGERPPVCLGVGRDPATWQSWPWRRDGRPCRIGVQDRSGALVVSDGTGPLFVVPTVCDIFRDWLTENDLTMAGPTRGLRHVLPVRSHPALVEVVGRSGELAGDRTEDDPLVFSSGAPLARIASASAAELARRSGLSPRAVQDIVYGRAAPSEGTLRRLLPAVVSVGDPARCAADNECRHAEDGLGAVLARGRRRWCGRPCKEVVRRRRRGIPPRRGRPGAHIGTKWDAAPALSSKGSGIPVAKGLDEPSCPGCGSIFIGHVPEACPDCGTPLPEKAMR
jgi:transcriptional regulator with XRE-family HTH domain